MLLQTSTSFLILQDPSSDMLRYKGQIGTSLGTFRDMKQQKGKVQRQKWTGLATDVDK